MPYDFNDAPAQRAFELIPAGTIAHISIRVRPGDAGDDGYLRRANDGASEGLDLELTIVGGPYSKRKFWTRFTLGGTTDGHKEAAQISRATLRAILESARGVRPDDHSEIAQKARQITTYANLNGLIFLGKVGVAPARNGFSAKNTLQAVLTPDQPAWQAEQRFSDKATEPPRPAPSIGRPSWAR